MATDFKFPRLLKGRPAILWIVGINIAAFLILRIIAVVLNLSGNTHLQQTMLEWVELPASIPLLVTRPWTVLTYMFCQYDAMHLIMNMLLLYWTGSLYSSVWGGKKLVHLYIYGGLAGAVTYILLYALSPALSPDGAFLIGSSASLFAVMTALAIRMPRLQVNLFLLGSVPVFAVVIFIIAFDIVLGAGGNNIGGHLAHIGGVAAGALYCYLPKIRLRSYSRAPEVTATPDDTRNLDAILDKIKSSGYASLTPSERKTLFEISSRIK